jgi:hypothetical protein
MVHYNKMLVKQHAKKLSLPIFLFVAFSTIIGITLLHASHPFLLIKPNPCTVRGRRKNPPILVQV